MGACCAKEYDNPAEVASKFFLDFVEGLPSMKGKTVAITGCTTGTGYYCARVCAQKGAKVVMLNRPSERADKALRNLKEEVPGATFTPMPCDLMSFASTRRAGQQLCQALAAEGLDVLCNNAGVMALQDVRTEDGFEVQMQVNHLSHFLLTAEVLPLLQKAAALRGEARVVNHSSGARKMGGLVEARYLEKSEPGALGGDDFGMAPFSGPPWDRYQQTKLANVVFTYALRDRLQAKGSGLKNIKSMCAHPGLASTNLQVKGVQDGGMGAGFTNLFMNAAQSGEDGTMGLLRGCCDPDAKTGDFFGPKEGTMGIPTGLAVLEAEEPLAPAESRELLWSTSVKSTGATFPF